MSLAALRNLLADLVTQAGGPRTPALAALTHAELARHPASSIAVALDGRTDDAGQFAVWTPATGRDSPLPREPTTQREDRGLDEPVDDRRDEHGARDPCREPRLQRERAPRPRRERVERPADRGVQEVDPVGDLPDVHERARPEPRDRRRAGPDGADEHRAGRRGDGAARDHERRRDVRALQIVMVERYVPGRELTCAVIGDFVTDVIEIVPLKGLEFYDYEAKYAPGGSKHELPAQLLPDVYQSVRSLALKAHQALGCRGVSRADFRFDDTPGGTGELICLEVNTQPGMTGTSLVPELAGYAGWSFGELVRWMVEDASCNR